VAVSPGLLQWLNTDDIIKEMKKKNKQAKN
jgi:hypothetical protein